MMAELTVTTEGACDDCGTYGPLLLYEGSVWLCWECLRVSQVDDR